MEKSKSSSPASQAEETAEPREAIDAQASDDLDDLGLKREPIAAWRLVVILASIGLGMFLSLMDTTIVATMLYSISEEFGGFRLSSWIVLSYGLSYVGFAVIIARLADTLGRKPVLIGSFVIFLAASMACAASKNMDQLIGFRAAQGAGGAGLYSLTMIIYPEISPPALVPLISALLGMVVALAGVSGPIFGGLLTSYVDWRYGFWINGPCAFVPAVLLFLVWPKNFQTFNKAHFRDLDYVGAVLSMAGTVLLVFILNQAAIREYAWNSAPTIIILTLSGLAWIGLVLWEWAVSRYSRLRHIRPQFPFRVLSDRVMMATIVSTVLTGYVMFVAVINIPLRAQIVNVSNAVKSGIILLPMMGATAVGSALGGAFSSKKNRTFITLNAASIFMLIGSGLMSALPDTFSVAKKQWGYEVVLGFGIGLNLSTTTFLTSLQVDFQDHAVAQGLVASMRVFGGSSGVAASFIILNAKIQETLTGILSQQQLQDFYRSPTAIFSFTTTQQLYVRETYVEAFSNDMRMCIGMSVACLIASLCTYQRDPPSIKKRLANLEAVYARSAVQTANVQHA